MRGERCVRGIRSLHADADSRCDARPEARPTGGADADPGLAPMETGSYRTERHCGGWPSGARHQPPEYLAERRSAMHRMTPRP